MRTIGTPLLAVLVALAATSAFGQGRRQAEAKEEDDRPWARGVSQKDRKEALELFRQGNLLLKDSVFVQAVAKYRDALEHWDHPAIHYNLVLALLNLDQPIDVHRHLEAAMRYGADPLDQDKFEQARAYKVLIEKQLSRLQVTCDVPGATVVLDGRPLFTAPGKYEGWVRAGPHSIVATADGYLTNEISQSLPPGKVSGFDMKLYSERDLVRYRRRWKAWIPWTVVGGSAAVALAGGLLHMGARDSFTAYDDGIKACGGCVPDDTLAGRLQSGQTQQTLALASYALGGAGLLAGATLVYLNQEEAYRLSPDEVGTGVKVSVVPVIGAGEGGLLASFRF